jgi:hypothetical protein
MSNFTRALNDLQRERKRMQQEIRTLDRALKRVVARSQVSVMPVQTRRMSLAGRRRIAAAQRERWARFRQEKQVA